MLISGVHPRMHHYVPAGVQLPVAGQANGVLPHSDLEEPNVQRQGSTLDSRLALYVIIHYHSLSFIIIHTRCPTPGLCTQFQVSSLRYHSHQFSLSFIIIHTGSHYHSLSFTPVHIIIHTGSHYHSLSFTPVLLSLHNTYLHFFHFTILTFISFTS